MRCFRCNKEFYDSNDLSRTLCDECLGRNAVGKAQFIIPNTDMQMCCENMLLVEDGSVDTDKLDELGIKYIVYRQGSQKPEMIKIWESMKDANKT